MRIRPHWTYLKYVLEHKYYVYKAGVVLKVPRLRLLVHDWDKFLPFMWTAYVNQFYTETKDPDREGYYHTPDKGRVEFNRAWARHINRNDHHWHHWVVPAVSFIEGEYEGRPTRYPSNMIVPMTDVALREMVADWSGAGMTQVGEPVPTRWYANNFHKMQIHRDTENQFPALFERLKGAFG